MNDTAPKLTPTTPGLRKLSEILSDLPGGKPCPATVWRWRTRGVQGVVLPGIMICGTYFSNDDAVAWFFNEVTRRRHAAPVVGNADAPTEEELAAVGLRIR